MADNPHAPLDDRLRKAFEADHRAVSRVAREALTAHAPARRRRRWFAAVSAAACLAAALVFWPSRPLPHVEPATAVLVGSVTDGLLVVPLPDGSVAITGGEARQDRPDEGYGLVLVEGDLR
jgi:peptidoglycan/LPS O-acetylase OafA/YrhL